MVGWELGTGSVKRLGPELSGILETSVGGSALLAVSSLAAGLRQVSLSLSSL